MIIRGGENIYPKEIEDFIYTHPKVSDVQVIGVPDKQYGEEIMACVILKDGEEHDRRGTQGICRFPHGKTQNTALCRFRRQLPDECRWKNSEI